MKVLKCVFCIFISCFIFINVNALEIQSNNAVLYNTNDNEIIFTKNENQKVQIASLTKIMTALVTLENIKNLNEKVVLKNEDFNKIKEENLVTAGFIANETVTYNDLLYGLLLPSGADAAKALARLVGGSEEKFIKKMNEKAKELNLKNTHFSNPIGLDDSSNYSTASDMSLLFMQALKNEDFKKIITTDSYKTSNGRLTIKGKTRKNSIVGDYILGGKTGTTDGAGLCLASIASKDRVNFLLVTLGAPYDKKGNHNFEDAKTIYEEFINNYGYQTIVEKGDKILTLKTKYTENDEVNFYSSQTIKKYLSNNYDKEDITSKYKGVNVITSKIKKNTTIGTLTFYYKDKKMASEKIILKEKQKFSYVKYIKDHKTETIVIVGSILVIFALLSIKRKKRKKKKIKSR